MPITVGPTESSNATIGQPQTKLIYAKGLWWIFYFNGTNYVYRTSSDLQNWSPETPIKACNAGYDMDFCYNPDYNPDYIYYIWTQRNYNNPALFRRGTLNTDGTISWEPEVTVASPSIVYIWTMPAICVTSNGTIVIHLSVRVGGKTSTQAFTNPNNDGSGTWSNTVLTSAVDSIADFVCGAVPLTAGKAYVTAALNSGPIYGYEWNGTQWLAQETIRADGATNGGWHGIVASGDDIYISFCDSATQTARVVAKIAGVWQAEETVSTTEPSNSGIFAAWEPNSNKLYLFWRDADVNKIYYAYKDTEWVVNVLVDLTADPSVNIIPNSVTTVRHASASTFPVVWTDAGNLIIQLEILSIAPPIVLTLDYTAPTKSATTGNVVLGDTVTFSGTLTEAGNPVQGASVNIIDEATGNPINQTPLTTDTNGSFTFDYTMPTTSGTYTYHAECSDPQATSDPLTITVEERAPTLTLSIDAGIAGEQTNWYGSLIDAEPEPDYPLPNRTIELYECTNDTCSAYTTTSPMATATTQSDGSYQGTFTLPTEAGYHYYQARFPGDAPASITMSGVQSNIVAVKVTAPQEPVEVKHQTPPAEQETTIEIKAETATEFIRRNWQIILILSSPFIIYGAYKAIRRITRK